MNEIGVDWISLITAMVLFRFSLFAAAIYVFLDTVFLAGFVDGPKIPVCFKLSVGFLSGASLGLIISSLFGDIGMMLLFSIATIYGLAFIRLWTWAKGLKISDFAAGKTIKMGRK